jgi:hypothetical protein
VLILLNEIDLQAIEKLTYSNNWITIILIVLFLSIFLLKVIDAARLKNILTISFSSSTFDNEENSKPSFSNNFQAVMFVFSVTVLSLVIYTFKFLKTSSSDNFLNFTYIFIGLLGYLLVKKILEKVISYIFILKNSIQFFVISKSKSFHTISFLLYILVIFYEYGNLKYDYLFYISILLFGVHFIYTLLKNKKLIFSKLFYFILYICAFEIAPLFVLFKLMF